MRTVLLLLLAACVTVFIASCGSDPPDGVSDEPVFQKEGTLTFLESDGTPITTIDIEIAETDDERKRGLMRRRSLGYERGMLFIFDTVDESSMWMKNTPLPLDIVFVDRDSSVINIVERTKPFSLDPIEPAAPKKFVVEVRAGFADRHDLTDSTRVQWTRTNGS
jgi:uncharacterized membrane protein (UPF0127 family)